MKTIDLATTSTESPTLVPPTRFAGMLSDARLKSGLSLEEICERAGGRYSIGDLRMIESGSMSLSDDALRSLASMYSINLAAVAPSRAILEIDRSEGRLIVGDKSGRFPPTEDDHQIMVRYLALVYKLRETEPGRPIPARNNDLDTLATVFGTTPDEVRRELELLMLKSVPEIRKMHRDLRKRVAIPALGLLVALTAMGGLILAPRGGGIEQKPATKPVASKLATTGNVNIGSGPLVISRASVDSKISTMSGVNIGDGPMVIERSSSSAQHVPVNIGEPLVIER